MDILEGLNSNQIAAVKATEGRVRVVAGAGSGKTRVLAHRYAYLVNEMGIDPANILCATFTNKAAQEMRNRIAKLVSAAHVNDFVCTIHGLCVKILREEIHRIGYPRKFTILDEEDQKSLSKEIFREFGFENNEVTTKQFLTSIHRLKTGGNEEKSGYEYYIESLLLPGTKVTSEKITPEIAYILKQRKSFLLDFEDLILISLYILNHFEEARERWQSQLNYIMLDEAQDCGPYDWSIINTVGAKHGNIFIVGDPDQCIYEWRGVNIEAFLRFNADTDIILDENYRSIPNILDVANSIISHNKKRIDKNLRTNKTGTAQAIHFHGKNEIEEYDWIALQIAKLKEQGCKGSDIAILYRSSHLSRGVEQALMRKGIKYEVWGGIRFFERKEIKDALSYLRLVAYQDDLSFKRVINTPSRTFGASSLEKLENIAAEENVSLFEALKKHKEDSFIIKQDKISEFVHLIDECKSDIGKKTIFDILEYLLRETEYTDLLRKDEDQDRIDNLNELLASINYYQETHEENRTNVDEYLQDIALYTNMDFRMEDPSVKLMTIHQAKGLEFPYVFVCGLSEGIFPSARTIRESKEAGLEEERRLMYVAVTRAEKGLFLSESEGISHSVVGGKFPSRFIREIKKSLYVIEGEFDESLFNRTDDIIHSIDRSPLGFINHHNDSYIFKVGDHVKHHALGIGTIVEVGKNGDNYVVDFKGNVRNIRAGYRFGRYFVPGTKVLYEKKEALVERRVDDDSLVISIDGQEQCVKDSELVEVDAPQKENSLTTPPIIITETRLKQKRQKTDFEKERKSPSEENKQLVSEVANLKKTISLQKVELSSLNEENNRQKNEMERQEATISAYERKIDLLRTINAEHEKQLEDKARNIRDLNQTIESLQKGKEESAIQLAEQREEIQHLKAEMDRINNMSVFKRIIRKK